MIPHRPRKRAMRSVGGVLRRRPDQRSLGFARESGVYLPTGEVVIARSPIIATGASGWMFHSMNEPS